MSATMSVALDPSQILGGRAVTEAASRTWDGETRSIVVDADGNAVPPGPYTLLDTLVRVLAVASRHDLSPGAQAVLLVHVVRPLDDF